MLDVGNARPCAHIVRIVQDVLIEVLVPDHIVRVPLCHRRQRHRSRYVHQAVPSTFTIALNPGQGLPVHAYGIGAVPDHLTT